MAAQPTASTWLLLIKQLPSQPAYLRVKFARRLAKVGAVALKSGVFVLPETDAALEDFQWIAREIAEDGGDASLSAARLLDGTTDEDVRALFRQERDADYAELAAAARQAAASLNGATAEAGAATAARRELARLQRRLEEVGTLDYFAAPGRVDAESALLDLRGRMDGRLDSDDATDQGDAMTKYRGRTWVTRVGVAVDRIASAWLIRRFIDPAATFKFVPAQGYRPAPEEVRFDMFEAEFTHEGDACTFEVLLRRLVTRESAPDAALQAIAEVVHDLDLKDSKYGRPEVAGVGRLLAGIAAGHADDTARLERGAALLDDLYASLGTPDAVAG